MQFTDETLQAYAKGALDEATRERLEAAMREDPKLARQIEALHAAGPAAGDAARPRAARLRLVRGRRLRDADEAGTAHPSGVSDLARARRAREPGSPRLSRGALLAALAALVAGFFVGQSLLAPRETGPVSVRDGALYASGLLAERLSEQLVAEQGENAQVRIGASFREASGAYCRTFLLREREAFAGLACRRDGEWRIELMASAVASAPLGRSTRLAGAEMPTLLRRAIEARVGGATLDPSGELEARARGWRD